MANEIKSLYKNIETFPKRIKSLSISELEQFELKDWYVRFRFYDVRNSQWKLKIKKGGVNYSGLSLKERRDLLIALEAAVKHKLKVEKWNPITNTYAASQSEIEEETDLDVLKKLFFFQALDYAYKKKLADWSKKSRQDYKSAVKYIKEAGFALQLYSVNISDLRRVHCKLILEKVKELRGFTNNGYNKYRDYLSSLLSLLEENEILEYNPVHKIKYKPVVKRVAHRPPTSTQHTAIIKAIKEKFYRYYRFVAVLYGCTLRPKEITRLKIKHLVRDLQVFRIIPDREEENSKTLIEREVIIPDWVLQLLDELHLDKFDENYYIFSTRNKYGTFMPGKNRMHSNTPTRWWRKIVKEDLKLNITQYSLKKLAGNDMIRLLYNERVNDLIKLPQGQMGHSTSAMTEIYVDEHKMIEREILKKKMPVL
jgi:hypothetical protein